MSETIAMPLHGMTCMSCVTRISARLRKVDGLIRFRIDLADEMLTVELDCSRADTAAIARAVREAGYELDVTGAVPGAMRESFASRLLFRWSGR